MMKTQLSLKSHTFLKDGAIFIADSHYSKKCETLYFLLLKIEKGEIKTNQIFLVGDIFHLLLDFKYLKTYNQKVIELIDRLSSKIEILYFEGNHDFCLDGIFNKNVKIFKELKKDNICINHGDIYISDKFYQIYVKIIRNKRFMKFVNVITFNFLNNWLFKILLNKKIRCDKMEEFQKLAKQKLKFYPNCDLIIEGHYHQDSFYKNYLNLPSLYCQKSFLQLKNGTFITISIENMINT